MNRKGQGALEYLLLIGGAVLVAVIVITLLLGIADQGKLDTQATVDAGAIKVCTERNAAICDTAASTYTALCTTNSTYDCQNP